MGKLVLSILLFVVIFIMLNSIEPAFATTFVISDQASCEAIGGVWTAATSSCILSISLTIDADDTLTINSGVTLEFTMGQNLNNHGVVTNNGILTLTGDANDKSGNIMNLDSSKFTNAGTINLIGAGGEQSGGLKIAGTSTFTNSNTMNLIGNSGRQSGYIGLMDSGKLLNDGSITMTGGSGLASALLDNWNGGTVENSGTITITGNIGPNSGRITNMGTSSFTNSGVISIAGGAGQKSGQLINSGSAHFFNSKTITITAISPTSNSNLFILDSSTLSNQGIITLPKNLVNLASLTNFKEITIGNNLNNQGNTLNKCGIITINGILIGNSINESICTTNSHLHEHPTIGKTSWGFQVVENGICIDIRCWTVTANYHQDFELVEILSDATHTISTTVFCHNGVSKCNYVAFGVSPYGTTISDSVWKIVLQKDHKDNWSMAVIDPNGYLGDVTSTTQIVNDEKNLVASITALFKKPTPGMVLHVETRDSYGGYRDFQFNDGIAIKDAYAYPVVDTSYEKPLEIESLCHNENSNKRYTCAFDMVRDWTIKNAEDALLQIK